MKTQFTVAKSRKQAEINYPWATRIIKVEGGYLCFESEDDLLIWRNQQFTENEMANPEWHEVELANGKRYLLRFYNGNPVVSVKTKTGWRSLNGYGRAFRGKEIAAVLAEAGYPDQAPQQK